MKILDIVLVIISVIALLGSLIAGYALMVMGEALQMLGTGTYGGIPGLQDSINLFSSFLMVGWVWIIAVVLSTLYAIWTGVQRIRGKSK